MKTLTAIEALELQEQKLAFGNFDEETAYLVGQSLQAAASARKAPVLLDRLRCQDFLPMKITT